MRSCKSPNVPRISFGGLSDKNKEWKKKKLKPKTGKFKDKFSEGTKRQFTGHIQEENNFLMPLSKKLFIETGGIHGYLNKDTVLETNLLENIFFRHFVSRNSQLCS